MGSDRTHMERKEKMRNSIIAGIIGISLPSLPFWEWDGPADMITAAGVFYLIALGLLIATEGGSHEKKDEKKRISGNRKHCAA